VRADDSAFTQGRGCYTSIRIRGGRPRFVERHLQRLEHGARALRIGPVENASIERALADLAAVFIDGEGVVRIQISSDGEGAVHIVGIPRDLGEDRPEWHAITAPVRHAGEVLPGGLKLTNRLALSLAAEFAREAGVDEALLFDGAERLIEGSRCNLVVVTRSGDAVTPPIELGAVHGIALQLATERAPELRERVISREDLASARELIALNSVRGARAVTRLDGRPVGDGTSGSFSAHLRQLLETD
jgi:branched-subunit amino acid aminotransferase/4-amino-4-deoxychorismate lyase